MPILGTYKGVLNVKFLSSTSNLVNDPMGALVTCISDMGKHTIDKVT